MSEEPENVIDFLHQLICTTKKDLVASCQAVASFSDN